MASDMMKGASGQAVREVQEKLLLLGYQLPRWGADASLGDETLAAVAAFLRDRQIGEIQDDLPTMIPAAIVELINAAAQKLENSTNAAPVLVDLRNAHSGQHRIAKRAWTKVTGITLHQTATLMGENAQRWFGIPVQVGVTRKGQILILNGCEWVTYHGNGLNAADVGIEIDGYYEGIEGKPATLWKPAQEPNRQGLIPTPIQVEAIKAAVRWIMNEVAQNGGAIKFIHAHRQASDQRQSDPGSGIWKRIGLWAQKDLGLSDGGRDFTVGTGLRIPEAWDETRLGIKY